VSSVPRPPAKIPLLDEEQPAKAPLETVKSPKSLALPVEAMVTYSMTLVPLPVKPPPNKALIFEEQELPLEVAVVKSPKSVALPVVANNTVAITFEADALLL
jgi:hypothetical protein